MARPVSYFDLATGLFFLVFFIKLIHLGFREWKRERADRFVDRPATWLQYSQPPLILIMIVLVYAGIFTDLFRMAITPNAGLLMRVTGMLLILSGVILAIWAIRTIGRDMQTDIAVNKGHVLRTEGAYAVVRHPMYLSLILLGLGAGLSTLNMLLIGYSLCIVAPVQFLRGRKEEELFIKHFGKAYDEYRRKTPLIFPFRFR